MKKINLKETLRLYSDLEQAQDHAKFCRTLRQFPERVAEAEERVRACRAELAADKSYLRLRDEIKQAEGRATVRCISAEDVLSTLREYTDRLGISKKSMEDIELWFDPNAQKFPRAYKFTPESTQFKAEFHGGAWHVTSIGRNVCTAKARWNVSLPDDAKNALIAKYC